MGVKENPQSVIPGIDTAPRPTAAPTLCSYAYTTHMPLLRKGQGGEGVRFLQQFLICCVYPIGFDGQFGPQTEQAVRDFQLRYRHYNYGSHTNPENGSLLVDGIVGKQTWRAIGNAYQFVAGC